MRRGLFILIAGLIASGALCLANYHFAGHLCCAHLARSTDDLDWLRTEFRLSDAEMARIRQLHEGYLPQCKDLCNRIAACQRELYHALETGTNAPSAAVDRKLAEIAALRAQCQANMLRHFTAVSQVMPPTQGRRYLAEMQRLTLGSHEQVEHRMAGDAPTSHGGR